MDQSRPLGSRYSFSEQLEVRIGSGKLRPAALARALERVMEEANLGIAEHLERMRNEPFFLVAATGLGKTVVVPVHVWLRQCERLDLVTGTPTTWIVEPRVLIAEEQARYMDASIGKLLRQKHGPRPPAIFGSITSKGTFNPKAPIKFVTTGVFTAKALSGDFSSATDRIVIDEAHETIAQNPDVELGIAVARSAGVHIDYMSATVQTSSIPKLLHIDPENVILATKKRFPIFAVNAGQPLSGCLVDVVNELLVRRDPSSKYLPPLGYPERDRILQDLFGEPDRSHALLVALNTITGPRSDLAVAKALLTQAALTLDGQPIDVLELSSKQTGSEHEMARFDRQRSAIEAQQRPYIVLATSVIEMGVTIPALDFVVTMDSGFQSVTVGDRTVPEIAPLPLNSLKQRLGRVGRKRSGVGIITREVGAVYTDYDAETLNSEAIEYEPVRTPLGTARLDSLALYTIKQDWRTPAETATGLASLGLASGDRLLTEQRLQDLVVERRALEALGAVGSNGLSELGTAAEAWIGTGWLPYAFTLERAWQSNSDMSEVAFWLVSLATSNVDLGSLLANESTVDELNRLSPLTHTELGFIDNLHTPLGRYDLLRGFYNRYARHLVRDTGFQSLAALSRSLLNRDCSDLDLSEQRVFAALLSISNVRDRFTKLHRSSERISELPELLPPLAAETRRKLLEEARGLPGQVALNVGPMPKSHPDARAWISTDGRALATAGAAVPALSEVELARARFTARLVMRRTPDVNGMWLEATDHWANAL